MRKKEIIWREILVQARLNKKTVFTQKELAASFRFSLSTVFNALKLPRQSHIIEVSGRNFKLNSYQKLLYLWASCRNLKSDLLYKSRIDFDIKKIESLMPPSINFGLYSAYSLLYKEAPADYDHIYIYSGASQLPEILKRLPEPNEKDKNPNFFVLKKDSWLSRYDSMPLEQIFTDIWNTPEWYAKDFLASLEEKLPF